MRPAILAALVAVLGISGAAPSSAQEFVPNYDESRVPGYALPDPLINPDGSPVADADGWFGSRRSEILNLFERHVYGETPDGGFIQRFTKVSENPLALGGLATRRQIVIHIAPETGRREAGIEGEGIEIDVIVYIPNERAGPAPAFVGLNFLGNHTVHADTGIATASGESRGARSHRWAVERILKRGYALVTAHYDDIGPDDDQGSFSNGIHPMFYRDGQTRPDSAEWGAIGAWAWGLSRMMDYVESDPDLDHDRAIAFGHSRLGKVSLWAGAQDERFAIVISNNSGCGGAALSKRAFGETVARINTRFPHWFNDNFKRYNEHESALPVDQHMLLALMAPRPVYVASAAEDLWADPRGEFLSTLHASRVYEVLGLPGLGVEEMPPVDRAAGSGMLGYHIRSGGHDVTPFDWDRYMDFADRHFYPFGDPFLPADERVADLVGRMTVDEKISQMLDVAPAIDRLGIPEYNWWNEALHGVARSGPATVFPQAIGLAATWDEDLMLRVATAISDEARAKHHRSARDGMRLRYQGLTFWSPNINIFRDPRWGRGQETYGEDPFLSGSMAVQFIRGLQGDDPTYLKTVATSKHFAVHNGPEPERHSFDAVVSERDLRETYLPHFERTVKEADVRSFMCAYNRVNGKAACGSELLIDEILRREWGFDGYIVSDCWALDDIFKNHKLVGTATEAAAVALKAGTDLDCGTNVYPHLKDALDQGMIAEADIDRAVERLFSARIRLGMLDPENLVDFTRIPYSVVDSPEHRELALEAARKSIVLLKNEADTLPLKRDLDRLAVIGPNADQWMMLLGNYNGTPFDTVTPLRGIREAVGPNTTVTYAQGSDHADGAPLYTTVPASVLFSDDGSAGLAGAYYATQDLTGSPLFTRIDSTISASWLEGSPHDSLDRDNFGIRWTGKLTASASGEYRFGVIATMRFELYIDGEEVLRSRYNYRDELGDPRLRKTETIALEAGRSYDIRLDAHETYAGAMIHLVWAPPRGDLESEAVETASNADAVILFLGLTPTLEGEEMDVEIEGFKGGDRTRIDLPDAQQRLLERIARLGKPTVVVLLSGSAVAVNWADENVPAILAGWYPGQAAGTAVADVLFGDYNPAGRLPVTFYRSVDDLPPFRQYAMTGHTYRFFAGDPLYPFGHGLSYTGFTYDSLAVGALRVVRGSDSDLPVTVTVTNSGDRSGEEVVQLYIRHLDSTVSRPVQELKGFSRIALDPDETATLSFSLRPRDLAYWDADTDQWVVEPGKFELRVGASSTDIRLTKEVEVE